jgi:hypothetical protein
MPDRLLGLSLTGKIKERMGTQASMPNLVPFFSNWVLSDSVSKVEWDQRSKGYHEQRGRI